MGQNIQAIRESFYSPQEDILRAVITVSQALLEAERNIAKNLVPILGNEKLKTIKLPFEILNPGEFLKKYF